MNRAAAVGQAGGTHHTAVIDRRSQQRIGRPGGHNHRAVTHFNQVAVLNLYGDLGRINLDRNRSTRQAQRDGLASGQYNCAALGNQCAGVVNVGRQQCDAATLCSGDRASVGNRCV